MTNAFSRSWHLTKLSFSVIKQDKELLAFPLLSGVFSILFVIAMIFPTVITSLLSGTSFEQGGLFYLSVFVIYFGLSFIATFFNVCTVYTTKIRFEGGNATFMQSIKFAFSKLYLIFLWSIVSASVGLLLRILDQLANKLEGAGEIIANIMISLLGAAWSILTLFVVPSLVYHDLTPFKAIKKSASTVKKTWGESLIRHYGLGLIQLIVLVLGALVFFGLFLLSASLGVYAIISVIVLAIIYLISVIAIFSVANSVFNTALFVYAEQGKIPEGFNKEVLAHTFESKKSH